MPPGRNAARVYAADPVSFKFRAVFSRGIQTLPIPPGGLEIGRSCPATGLTSTTEPSSRTAGWRFCVVRPVACHTPCGSISVIVVPHLALR